MNEIKPSASKEEGAIQTDKKDQSRCDESSGSEDPYANYDSDNKGSKKLKVENKKNESNEIKNEESESDKSSSVDSQSHQSEEEERKMTSKSKDDTSKSKSETMYSNHDSDNKDSNRSEVENETAEKKAPNEIKNEEIESDISSSDDSQSGSKIKSKSKNKKNKRPNPKEKKEQKRHIKNQKMTNKSKDEPNISQSETKPKSESKSETKNETETKPISTENISRDKNESSKEQKINLRFYVYAPPEFNVDFKTCFFGILHNLGEWKQENIIKLNFRKFENGFLITGDHSFDAKKLKHENNFEYKYCLVPDNDYEVEPFIEYYQGFKKNRILNFANFSPDTVHSIYDGIMLPPDEGNQSSWEKITKSVFSKFVKRFFTDEMSGNYLEDTIKAMLHEIPTINEDDERIKKFNNAKYFMNAIIDSIYKSFKKIKNDYLLKIFAKIYIEILEKNQKLTICNSLVLLEYVYRSEIKLNSDEIIMIQNIIMNNNCENASEFKNIDTFVLAKAIWSDRRFIYLFEIWIKLKLKADSIDNKYYFDRNYFDIIRQIMEKLSFDNIELYKKILMMLDFKRSKIIECVLFSFYIINDIIPDERIAEIFTIWEIIGNLCFFTFQIENSWIQTAIFRKIRFDQNLQMRLLNIIRISFGKFINSSDENDLKTAENLEFISKSYSFLLNNGQLKSFFKENYSTFLILFTKLYVHKNICYIDQEKKDNENQVISLNLKNLKDLHENCLILKFYPSESYLKKTLFNWSLLNEIVDVSNEDIGKIVKDLLNQIYFKSFQNMDSFRRLVEICSSILKKEIYVHSNVERKIFDEMILRIDKINQKDLNQFTQLPDHNNNLVNNLIYEIISKKWPASEDPFGIFNFLFECNNFLRVFLYKNFFQTDEYLESRIMQIISLLEVTFDGLIDGKIEIYLVRLLSENGKTLFELYQLFETRLASKFNDRSNLATIQNLLKIRFSQIGTIENFLAMMNEMLKFFKMLYSKGIKINCQNFEAKLKNFKDYDSKKINDLSECNLDDFNVNLNQIDAKENLIKRIKNFDEIDKIKIEKFKYFIEISKENTYLLFYIQESINEFQKPVDLKSFLDQILDVALFKFKKLGEDLKNGKLDLRYFSNEIAKIGKNLKIEKENDLYKTELIKAMVLVQTPEKEIDFRLKQLKHFLNLPKIKEISELLLEIKKKENLNNDFGPLEQIQESLEESQNQFRYLDDIRSSSMKLFESLDKLSDEKFVKCLRKYVEHFKFIEWLRSNASNLNELKLLCEFASQSENEGALEVVRVQSLLLVGTGFAPLIYDMKKDCSYDQMIKHIKQIFNNFSRNRELPEKIDAISKEKNWLKEIKESMGNTEANSLKQADRINKFGIFEIGLKANSRIDNLSLDDVIRVSVPKSKENDQKSYSFNQLRDLQDKLTLVVGKDETEQEIIEYFESVLESLINLGDIFLILLQNGNVLFSKWNATIYNEKSYTNTMKINFGIQNYSQNIFAKRECEKTTVTSIDKTFKFLKKCSQEWLSHIDQMRNKFINLNHFRINQLVDLRILMAKFISRETEKFEDSELKNLLDLLFDINPKVNANCIHLANQHAQAIICEEPLNVNDSNEVNLESEQLVNELIELGFERKLILQGIKELNTTDKEQLTNFCFENELKNIEPKNMNSTLIKSEKLVSDITSDLNSRDDPYNDEQSDDLQEKYDTIWKRFLEYLNLNFQDYVSLNHLGLALDYIKQNSSISIHREKPAFLEYNRANLIVCPQEEIISRTLYIYSMSAEQPLPSKDEVLYCNSNTTTDEIELFWLRVLTKYQENEKEQKIYSLINVQDLLYDQAVKAQASFEKLMANYSTNNKFLLCIICSTEREDKSVFVTAFNRYRKNFNLPNNINQNLNGYLRKQFRQKKDPFFEDKFGKELLSVQVITSDRAGVGKSLYVQRQIENSKLKTNPNLMDKCVSIKKQTLPFESVFEIFKNFEKEQCRNKFAKIYHIDIAYEVWYEVDYFLFNLLCLGVIVNSNGKMFRRSPTDLYLIEIMSPKFKPKDSQDDDQMKPLHSILKILPSLKCISPVQVFDYMSKNAQLPEDLCPILFDQTILNSELIQRPCQYLHALDHNQNINVISYNPNDNMDAKTCLELLLKHLECETASWSEIINFAKFLNTQLMDCERSYYCDPSLTGEDLPGFKAFVVKFMVQMSHDFALPSLEISDRSALQLVDSNQAEFQLNQLKMRRKWENDPHPYLFFNPDGQTFTFFGFYVDRRTGQIIDFQTKSPLFENRLSLSVDLIHGLYAQNKSILYENIADLPKEAKIQKLLSVMGINSDRVVDPDPSYELTMDNLLKILAIYMRLRADIPVIIMGETGCGKTRLCRYMCDLLKYFHQNVENMYLVKVHGGTMAEEIIRHVQKAEDLARKNWALGSGIFTILFFDEANSTEAIGTIKEIMCDSRVNGIPLDKNHGLKIIAACNPYKKHSDEIIQNFDKSGLGFYVDINETQEKLGDLPMRHLVYRVQPLPASMLPMIWDFGQLNDQVEKLYINQIVRKKLERLFSQNEMNLIVEVLCASQKFMREQNNECSFVSLRDVQRVLKIIQWFMAKAENIFRHLKPRVDRNSPDMLRAESILTLNQIDETENDEDLLNTETPIENSERHELLLSSIILALNACYHVGLQSEESRTKYRIKISSCFENHAIDQDYFLKEIDNCYEKFLNEIKLPDAIARNQALKENIFMILICIELKIPLFIIGKPGSSKSLAKTLISNKMQGSDRNSSPLLSTFKEAHLITFQCSPMSTSEMILNTFRYCARYQFERRNDLDRYTSVIVLDEIGLAEASASMPLKTLHPLLEDGVHFEEKEEQELCKKISKGNLYEQNWNQIGFIGISNWVLDPAKMNRGIFVNRNNPSTSELKDTVVGICKNDTKVLEKLTQQRLIESLSTAYLNLCEKARNKIREFFGLRDFYALIKMIYWHTKESESNEIDWLFLERAIKRNFGGLVDLDPSGTFIKQFQDDKINLKITNNNLNVIDLIKEALLKRTTEDENRYLLLLSQNDNALDLINNFVLNELDNGSKHSKIKIIFGSSFPNDQKYSQICRKIHQIKLSMELGKTVILLNLENLYESLYDALNQFYYKFGDDTKFVDLGLGTARVKCLVHEEFRLIVVADKKSVYNPKKYPIPLVNRLEKHLLSIDSILNEKLRYIVNNIQHWTKEFTSISEKYGFGMRKTNCLNKLKPSDIFIGFTDETIASLVYKISKEKFENILLVEESDEDWVQSSERVQEMVKIVLIQSSTSDGVIRLLPEKKINNQKLDLDFVIDNYYKFQAHENFDSFFQKYLLQPLPRENFIQITTHSKLLSSKSITIANAKFRIESLLSFDSQQQFVQVLKEFFTANLKETRSDQDTNVLIVQCDCGHIYTDLVNCARFAIIDEYTKYVSDLTIEQLAQVPNDFFVVFIIQVPKIAGGCFNGFQTSKWFCYHIDDLQNNVCVDNILDYENKTLSQVFDESLPDTDEKSFKILINILHSVIFNACSRVTDNYSGKRPHKSDETKSRAIQRIEKLLSIFKDQNLHSKFFPILIKHLARLQSERETVLSTDQVSRSWILNEVSKISNVIKYATLKNSCQNYIENRVAHLFSGIIALIDRNQNLDLLLQPEKEWSRDFWLQIFDDNEILDLKYVTNYNKANHREKNEFICFNNFNSDHYSELRLKLPFSWIIKDYFDKLTQLKIKEIETSDGDAQIGDNGKNDHFRQQLQNAFEQSILKKKLDNFFDSVSQNEKIEFMMAYVNDFILLSSSEPFISVNHFRLVKNRLMQYCKKNYCRLQNDLNFLIGLHCSYEKLNLEIKLFSKFAKIDPKCIDLIAKSDNQDSNISFLAARILCNNFVNISNEMKVDQWFEWFERVQKTTALIEKMMDLSTEIKSEKFEEFDSLWQRTTLLKLYIENICIKENDLYQRCFQFWKFFDTIVDFKKKETFEKFIKILDPIFKFGKNLAKKFSIKCLGCESQEPDALFTTPDCPRCLVCIVCINKTQLNKRCQKCTKELKFDERIYFKKISGNDEYKQKISFLKINFNTFYMDVVKNLCFCRPNEKLPEDQVIDLIIKCLLPKTNGEKASTTLDFNHTPSIKSSLFQLLLNFNENVMRKHLLEIFTKSENYLRENYNKKDLISLKLMYLNAIEDNLYSRSSLVKNEQNFDHDIQLAVRTLKDLLNQKYEMEDEVSRLKFVAKIRFCLTTCSKLVTNIDQSCEHHMELIRLVKIQINRNKSWFRLFLIKNIFRIHGRAETMKIANQEILRDFVPPDLVTDRNNRPKIYDIFGSKYKEIQKLIEDCLITEDYNKIKNRKTDDQNNFVYFFLAIFEISSNGNLIQIENEKFKKIIENVKISFGKNKENFDLLLNNNSLPIANEHKQNFDLNIQFLLMHVFASSLKNQSGTILELFIKLINNPEKYAQCFLPSIPHDDDFEAYQTFATNGKENVAWFRCPNGHLYTIGECKRPNQASTCPTCNSPIGGLSYNLNPGNTKVDGITEKKSQGYSLDPNDDKQSIRNMGQLNTILTRLLLDCCMFLSSFKNPAQTKRLVHSPNVDAQNLQDFFLNLIKQNIKKLSQCLQHSPEESLLLFHHFIHKIGTVACPFNGFDSRLTKKTDRNNFEQILCAFIKDRVFENKSVDNKIEELNTILKDNASDSDGLFRIAYDLIESPQDEDFRNQKQFWTFRRQITLDVMKQNFSVLPNQQKTKDFKFLSEFLERMDTLKAVKYLPSLLKMVDTFFKIFNRQIDRQTSLEIKLSDVLNDNPMFKMDQILKNQIENGARNFLKAWKMISAQIISKFDKKNFEKSIEILLNTEIDKFGEIPIAFFLPNSKNEGFLIYSLLFYLINVQNEFIQFYVGNILNKSVIENTVTIGLENLTKNDLISFSPEKDILRLVYIHSNYSLEESKNINLEFDFNKIQNSIERKLIADKPLIDIRGILLIEFSDNTRNDLKRFESLERRVKQQELSFVIKEKICFFYKKPDQLNDIIRKLNIVIDFINSTGCPEDIKIIDYAIDTLKMTNIDGSNINKQISELDVSYLKSLWNLLNLRRAILLTEHRQEPFDALNDAFRHPIQKEHDIQENGFDDNDGNENEELAKMIMSDKYQKPENMLIILEFLYKYVIYKLIPNSESFEKSKNDEAELLNGEIPIEHVFNELANDTDFSQDQVVFQTIDLNNVKLKNVNHLWKILVIIYLKNSNL